MGKAQPIRDPFGFILPLGKSDYTSSTVVGITGPKRSGKSLLLAKLLWRDLIAGRKVWSNMTVKTPKFYLDKGFPMLETKPIDWDGLYLLSEEYQEGTIGLDESVYYDDSRASLSMRNRLMNTIMNQVGHRNLNVYYTVKAQGWLDRRLQFETDIEIQCQDMAKTRWGRQNHIIPGTLIHFKAFDKSGSVTGKVYDAKDRHSRPIKSWFWDGGRIYWTAYDTKEIIGLEEMYTGVKLDLKQRVISNKAQVDESTKQSLYDIVSKMREADTRVDADTFWQAIAATGIEGDARQLGTYLRQLGVIRRQGTSGRYYDLTNLLAQHE